MIIMTTLNQGKEAFVMKFAAIMMMMCMHMRTMCMCFAAVISDQTSEPALAH